MTEFHFWAYVMLQQPCVWASRTSPAQKLWGLRVVFSPKTFLGLHFLFSGAFIIGRYGFDLFAVNKFEEKVQCEYVRNTAF